MVANVFSPPNVRVRVFLGEDPGAGVKKEADQGLPVLPLDQVVADSREKYFRRRKPENLVRQTPTDLPADVLCVFRELPEVVQKRLYFLPCGFVGNIPFEGNGAEEIRLGPSWLAAETILSRQKPGRGR